MNDCKFKEEETTAAVYNLLGYQNPALPAATLPAAATAAAPVALQAPAPAAEPVLDKWADEVDTKKNFLPKKGVARKLGGSVAKVAGGKGVDGAMKSKNINDMGLDNSGDGTTVSDKHKPKAKEKVKRTRPNEGCFLNLCVLLSSPFYTRLYKFDICLILPVQMSRTMIFDGCSLLYIKALL
jgi:hypothetical protein